MLRRVDSWAGLLCVLVGIVTLWEANSYSIGTLGEMGPGFYPAVLGTLLAAIGCAIAWSGAETVADDPLHAFPAGPEWRGRICIVAAIVVFIAASTRLGMVITTFAAVFIAALGDRLSTWRASLVLASGLSVFGAVLFHTLLGVALPVWPVLR